MALFVYDLINDVLLMIALKEDTDPWTQNYLKYFVGGFVAEQLNNIYFTFIAFRNYNSNLIAPAITHTRCLKVHMLMNLKNFQIMALVQKKLPQKSKISLFVFQNLREFLLVTAILPYNSWVSIQISRKDDQRRKAFIIFKFTMLGIQVSLYGICLIMLAILKISLWRRDKNSSGDRISWRDESLAQELNSAVESAIQELISPTNPVQTSKVPSVVSIPA
jgi:hypothetical protein